MVWKFLYSNDAKVLLFSAAASRTESLRQRRFFKRRNSVWSCLKTRETPSGESAFKVELEGALRLVFLAPPAGPLV